MTKSFQNERKAASTLSVVISNYNHGKYLPEALRAILGQSRRPVEVIVIDDCSTDNSVEVIEEFARRDPLIRLFRNEQNKGVIFSTNRGLSLATGDYVYFGAADDRICAGLFEKSMALLAEHPQAGLCSALLQLIGPDGEDKGWISTPVISNKPCYLSPAKVIADLTAYGFWFTGQTIVYRREAIVNDTDGFLQELAHRTDHFVDYVVAAKHGACFIPEVLATYRILASGYAETVFDNEQLSRSTFTRLLELMRSPRYAPLFPEGFVHSLEDRGWYDLEVRTLRRLFQGQMDFIARLKALKPNASLLDKLFFLLLTLLTIVASTVAKIYLWHRRINWDMRWVMMKVKTRFSKHARSLPSGGN
jgi:glycosyltransferase involved in cell wall biosynthesis